MGQVVGEAPFAHQGIAGVAEPVVEGVDHGRQFHPAFRHTQRRFVGDAAPGQVGTQHGQRRQGAPHRPPHQRQAGQQAQAQGHQQHQRHLAHKGGAPGHAFRRGDAQLAVADGEHPPGFALDLLLAEAVLGQRQSGAGGAAGTGQHLAAQAADFTGDAAQGQGAGLLQFQVAGGVAFQQRHHHARGRRQALVQHPRDPVTDLAVQPHRQHQPQHRQPQPHAQQQAAAQTGGPHHGGVPSR